VARRRIHILAPFRHSLPGSSEGVMIVVWLIIVGAAAGFIATRLMGMETDPISTIAIGVIGALAGGLVLRFILTVGGWLGGFVGAVLGAMALIWLWKTYGPRDR
jgi:uncharacterized membrane protein YeaQ/YmgE (transglycosylase-associated protein family)